MVNFVKVLSLLAVAGVSLAAPQSSSGSSPSATQSATSSGSSSSSSTSSSSSAPSSSSSSSSGGKSGGGSVTVTVQNKCSHGLHVYKLDNGNTGSPDNQDVGAGSSHDFQVDGGWSGRFWGCEDGKSGCSDYGSAVSLAEFQFSGWGGKDFYDISFVDGFNLPMSISPEGKSGSGYDCGAPKCASLPKCPKGLEGENGACKSACAAYGTPEYCCTGQYNSPDKCKASSLAKTFKDGCPDAYSYAYDDAKSTFACSSKKYTVVFCP
ncbi:hypothetical protein O0I10_006911 [Lichtheimia ornata]|uniref:Thaumatin-like protein n=1 Tax=Lichtheimia ornata TaxID=688661 RepID=A0AAD7V2D8_9FUNG|nr:uncharacterized protein O0I10_006911 [Lichtheimia ornata]KAJ8657358.1 hypothetical protein O0I10_006911 [Lichtheimia ornata]